MLISNVIEGVTKANNISVEEFAQKIGVSKSSVYKWKRGDTHPDFVALVSILRNFPQLSPEWLLLGEGPMYRGGSTEVADSSIKNLSNGENIGKLAKKGFSPMTDQEREEHRRMLDQVSKLEEQVRQLLEANQSQAATIARLVGMLEGKGK